MKQKYETIYDQSTEILTETINFRKYLNNIYCKTT
jgi:hypothetical protein